MSRGKPRWNDDAVRHLYPLPGERLNAPRFDGAYTPADGAGPSLRFARDGTVSVDDGATGTWACDNKLLRISTATWSAEGAIGPGGVQLLVQRLGAGGPRSGWDLDFVAAD